MPARLDAAAPDFEKRLRLLIDRRRADEAEAERAAADIIRRVRTEGDAALIDLTRRFDRLELLPEALRIKPDEIAAASACCEAGQRAALEQARDRIEAYHRRQLPEDADWRAMWRRSLPDRRCAGSSRAAERARPRRTGECTRPARRAGRNGGA